MYSVRQATLDLFSIQARQEFAVVGDHLYSQKRHIGDFTNWTDLQMYQSAFERRLRDLKQG